MPRDDDVLTAWQTIPGLVRGLVEDRSPAALDHVPPGAPMSARQLVHHIVEANVVAASITIAALGSPGCTYDWSWMLPFGPWLDRMAYDRKPVEPALLLLDALNAYVVAQVAPLPHGLQRTVRLVDAPGAESRTVTVADVLRQEVRHAREHVDPTRSRADGAPGGAPGSTPGTG